MTTSKSTDAPPRITAEMLLEQLRFVPDLDIPQCCELHVLEVLQTAIINARADGRDVKVAGQGEAAQPLLGVLDPIEDVVGRIWQLTAGSRDGWSRLELRGLIEQLMHRATTSPSPASCPKCNALLESKQDGSGDYHACRACGFGAPDKGEAELGYCL